MLCYALTATKRAFAHRTVFSSSLTSGGQTPSRTSSGARETIRLTVAALALALYSLWLYIFRHARIVEDESF